MEHSSSAIVGTQVEQHQSHLNMASDTTRIAVFVVSCPKPELRHKSPSICMRVHSRSSRAHLQILAITAVSVHEDVSTFYFLSICAEDSCSPDPAAFRSSRNLPSHWAQNLLFWYLFRALKTRNNFFRLDYPVGHDSSGISSPISATCLCTRTFFEKMTFDLSIRFPNQPYRSVFATSSSQVFR